MDRGVGAWQAGRAVYNTAQLRWLLAVQDVRAEQVRSALRRFFPAPPLHTNRAGPRAEQRACENASIALVARMDRELLKALAAAAAPAAPAAAVAVAAAYARNAQAAVADWWSLSDTLLLRYADGYCNGGGGACAAAGRKPGYPRAWLEEVGFQDGPPPPPPVVPPTGHYRVL